MSFHSFVSRALGQQATDLLHLLLKERLHCLVLVLQVPMELLCLSRYLTLERRKLLRVVAAVFLELGFQALLLGNQVLDLPFKGLYPVRNVILFHWRLEFGQDG